MEEFKKLLADCMDDYDTADDDSDAEWPYNAISQNAVFNFEQGFFGENKDPISPEEVELCQRLSKEAKEIFGDREVGLGSEGGESMVPFWLVATKDKSDVPKDITVDLIRDRFDGTINPVSQITVFPLSEEKNKFTDQIEQDHEGMSEDDSTWSKTIQWFKDQKSFIATAMIYVGMDNPEGSEEDWPEGIENSPCCLPRMMLGLTQNGSLTGLFSYVVYT